MRRPSPWPGNAADRGAPEPQPRDASAQALGMMRLDLAGLASPAGSRPPPAGKPAGLAARVRAWAGGSAWAPLLGKLAGYVAGFVALALVGSGAASWRLGAAGGALAMGLGPAPPPPSASETAPAAVAGLAGDEPHAPRESVADAGAADAPPVDAGSGTGGITADGRVILNLATEDDLRRLPGVGPAKARAIVALRTKLGKLRRPEDLLRVKGIGRRSLARMRPLLVVDPP
jgi:competence protein ComEA